MDEGREGDTIYRDQLGPSDKNRKANGGEAELILSNSLEHQEFFSRLSPAEKQLLLLRNELYNGSWDEMEQDLRHRLERKPYIFRLMNRIEEDLSRIKELREYEDRQGIDLGVFLDAGNDDNK